MLAPEREGFWVLGRVLGLWVWLSLTFVFFRFGVQGFRPPSGVWDFRGASPVFRQLFDVLTRLQSCHVPKPPELNPKS